MMLRALDYRASLEESIVESAERFRDVVVSALDDEGTLPVTFKGLRGPPSTYFNIILQSIVAKHGMDAISRLDVEFNSEAQREVWDSAVDAVQQMPPERNVSGSN